MTTTNLTIVRQNYQYSGGAEKFVENTVNELAKHKVGITVAARAWNQPISGRLVRCNPPYFGRLWRDWGFQRCICNRFPVQASRLVQSHERIPCCDLYRAGDGVHREWLKQRARAFGPLERLHQSLSLYHHYVLRTERRLFESTRLRAVICNSQMVKDEILNYFSIDPGKLHVIYSGVDSARFSPQLRVRHCEALRSHWQIPLDAIVFLYVGSGFARKGVKYLLHAFQRLPKSAYLLIVGKEKRQLKYQRIAEQLQIQARVRFAGPQTAIAEFYGAADVFVLPTLYDPFPNVTLEAMAAGLPVITGIKAGTTDILDDASNGFYCDPLDTEALSQRMCRLLEPSLRHQVSQRARRTVEPMSFDKMSRELTALYDRLLTRN